MLIQKMSPEAFSKAYGILCLGAHPWQGVAEAPFYATWCAIEPGHVARAHKHQEHEVFAIVKGRGMMRVDDERVEVGPGDMVFMQPWNVHELTNLSDEDDLLFLDLCWESMEEAAADNEAALSTVAERSEHELVIATPPTANGDLHVGHLAGPFLAADIYARYQRLRGVEVTYLTGADRHPTYVAARAHQLGEAPAAIAERFGQQMAETLGRANIEVDHWARPDRSPHHVSWTRDVFATLFERGVLVARDAPTLYCEPCRQWLHEAFVHGKCPHCGADSGGNACESCGRPNDCVDLIEPRCSLCQGEPQTRDVERIYLPLAPFADRLETFWSEVGMSSHLQALCSQMLADGLPDIAVSHPGEWGIPVPVESFEGQRIYVWFEMAPGFLAATREALEGRQDAPDWRQLWTAERHEIRQFFGFDNGYFFALLFPAIQMAYDGDLHLPKTFLVNELYRYEGSKFSTSRNHGLQARELLAQVPVDTARFFLAYDGPEREQTTFSMAALRETVERQLAGDWQTWLRGFAEGVEEEFEGVVPGTGAWTDEQQRFFRTLGQLVASAAEAYEAATFSPRRAARVLCQLVEEARRFAGSEEHWRGLAHRFEERRTAVALEALAAKTLAQLAAPIMPGFAQDLWHSLGCNGELRWDETPEFPSGQKIRPELSQTSLGLS
ncbi:MAG: class I tRNA ligase family protein [Acidobacteriota bacterium]